MWPIDRYVIVQDFFFFPNQHFSQNCCIVPKKHKENAGKTPKKFKYTKSKKILKFYPNDTI